MFIPSNCVPVTQEIPHTDLFVTSFKEGLFSVCITVQNKACIYSLMRAKQASVRFSSDMKKIVPA